jgi:hypothetical protein
MELNKYIILPNGTPSNFKYSEFTDSYTALRHGIDNIPKDPEIWRNIERLVGNVLQPVRDKMGIVIIKSGYRCPELNKVIGGSTNSNHTRGEAADFVVAQEGRTILTVCKWIAKQLEFRELIAEYPPDGWVHVAYRQYANNNEIKLKDNDHNYAKVDIKHIIRVHGTRGDGRG